MDRPDTVAAAESAAFRLLRSILLAILAFSIIGTGTELVLLEHYESTLQWVPLVSLTLGLAALIAVALRPSRATVRLFQALMLAYLVVGMVGIFFHYRGNVEFARETYPALTGGKLIWEAATGATPALAPGTILQLGLLGLAAMFRHPRLRTLDHATLDKRPT